MEKKKRGERSGEKKKERRGEREREHIVLTGYVMIFKMHVTPSLFIKLSDYQFILVGQICVN